MTQHTTWWQRSRRSPRGVHIARTVLALTVLVAACSIYGCGQAGGTQATATPSLPATTPTPSKPTIPQSSAILGGSVVAFDNKFGASNCCYRNGWDYQGPSGPMWTGVQTGHNFASNVDERSTDRVTAIETGGRQNSDLKATVTQGKTICGSFLPSDAEYHTSNTAYLGNLVAGIELNYSSTLLANTLPADDFTDKNGKATPPGTFYVYYEYTYNGSSTPLVAQCALATDESFVPLPS